MPGRNGSDERQRTHIVPSFRLFFPRVIQNSASFDGVAVVNVVIFQRYVPFAVIVFICCWRWQRARARSLSRSLAAKHSAFIMDLRGKISRNRNISSEANLKMHTQSVLVLRAPRNGNSSANDYYYRYYYSSFPFHPGPSTASFTKM